MIQHVNSYLWPCLTFFKLKTTNILKSSGWGLEKSGLPWNNIFLTAIVVFLVELLVYPEFQWSALQIGHGSSIYIFNIIFNNYSLKSR